MATPAFQSTSYGNQFAGITLEGTDKLIAVLEQLGEHATTAMAGALFREANLIMTDAKEQTPVDTGTLRDSGHVEEPVINGTEVSVEMGFGGPAEKYAIIVHEDLAAHHNVGNAKYLENPALEHAATMEDRIAKDLKQDLTPNV